MRRRRPTNRELYCGGHVEVPAHCNPIRGLTACGECCGTVAAAAAAATAAATAVPADSIISDGVPMPGGTGYDDSYGPTPHAADRHQRLPDRRHIADRSPTR